WLKLIDDLGDDDADVRKDAAKKLDGLGEGVVPALRRAGRSHPDVDVRLRAGVVAAGIEGRLYREVRSFQGHGTEGSAFALSPDGKRMVSGCWGDLSERVARVWDVETGKELFQLKGHDSCLSCVAFSPDGRRILTGSPDRTVRLWDAKTGKALKTLSRKQPWDADSRHASLVHAVLFTPDGKSAVSCGHESAILVWDLAAGKLARRIHVGIEGGSEQQAIGRLAWAPDGKRL